jgi:hypothetical protein
VKIPFPPLLRAIRGGRGGVNRRWTSGARKPAPLSRRQAFRGGPVLDVVIQVIHVIHVIVMTQAGRRMQTSQLLYGDA